MTDGPPNITDATNDATAEEASDGQDVAVDAGVAAVQVSAGGDHTCARLSSGEVRCWGANTYGGVGDGTSSDRWFPVGVALPGVAVEISAGVDATCAVLASGSIMCWGLNSSGGLGDGTTTSRYSPTVVASLGGLGAAVSISGSSAGHTCAILSSEALRCWGGNANGQLGDGTTISRTLPGPVSSAGASIDIATGGSHTCDVVSSGGARCWGDNSQGELGDGTNTRRLVPQGVVGLSSAAISVTTGVRHTCALLKSGAIQCWGRNATGQLGDGTAIQRNAPVDVIALGGPATAVSAGYDHTCALVAGSVRCWGGNTAGQLGDGTKTQRNSPVIVPLDASAIGVSAGWSYSCAILTTGGVRCWGLNTWGQLGDGTTTASTTPVAALNIP